MRQEELDAVRRTWAYRVRLIVLGLLLVVLAGLPFTPLPTSPLSLAAWIVAGFALLLLAIELAILRAVHQRRRLQQRSKPLVRPRKPMAFDARRERP